MSATPQQRETLLKAGDETMAGALTGCTPTCSQNEPSPIKSSTALREAPACPLFLGVAQRKHRTGIRSHLTQAFGMQQNSPLRDFTTVSLPANIRHSARRPHQARWCCHPKRQPKRTGCSLRTAYLPLLSMDLVSDESQSRALWRAC